MATSEPFELICHHSYDTFDGLPVDMSDYGCHGRSEGTTFLVDGVTAGSGALSFSGADRVVIPRTSVWEKLVGIKIECVARLAGPTGKFQMLVAADQSFGFHLLGYHAAMPLALAAYVKDASGVSASGTEAISTYQDPPNPAQPGFPVQYNTWVKLGFVHDGASMRLFLNDQLVAARSAGFSAVPGAGPAGVSIGNLTNDDALLNGDIDDVKVWRLNPHIVDTAFFARPIDRKSADCLDEFLHRLATALERDPECAVGVYRAITDAIKRMLRAIMSQGPETRERFSRTSQRYFQLWQEGRLDGSEMAQLLADWCAWLRLIGVSAEDRELAACLRSDCVKRLLAGCATLECDTQLTALMDLLARTCSGGTAQSA